MDAQLFGEKQLIISCTGSLHDFLKAPSPSNVSDATEDTQVSNSSSSSARGSATMTFMGISTRDRGFLANRNFPKTVVSLT